MDNTQLLISGYLDGELTDDEVSQLAAVLGTDVASLDQFVLQSVIHSQLLDWTNQERVQDRAMGAAFAGSEAPLSGSDWKTTGTMRRAARGGAARVRFRHPSLAALAAALLIAASISAVTYVVSSRPVYVGQLTDATNCSWAATQADIPVGTLLEGGQELELRSGRAVITFASGAKFLLEGPVSVRLDSDMAVWLQHGRVAAKVPRQAINFTVSSSLARFVDLGTQFALNLDAEKSFQLHVFEGLVEVQLDKRFGKAARQPARVAEVHAASFDIKTGDVEFPKFEEGKKMPF